MKTAQQLLRGGMATKRIISFGREMQRGGSGAETAGRKDLRVTHHLTI